MEAVQAFFICLCFYLFSQKREGWGFFSLGCAVMSKYFAIVFMPFLINAKNWKKIVFLLGALVVFTLPFLNTISYLFTSLVPLGTVMHYNDSLTALLRAILGPKAIWMSVILLGVCLSVIFLIVHEPLRSSYLAAGCLLLLLGTLHPWYLILITPFLVFFPSRAWLYLHFAVVFTFPVLHAEQFAGVFQEIHWLKLPEYLPFYGLLLWDFFRNRQIFPGPYFKPVAGISVVIPTLNESRNIGRCLDTLRKEKAVLETTVVDGGSTDGTQEIATSMGARTIKAKKGRGNQIRAGIHQCQGDLILILHADCLIRKSTLTRVLQELILDGAIGHVRQIHGWSKRDRFITARGIARPKKTPPVPNMLNWDLWLGPAPYRPYHPAYLPFRWRGWWDFGTGVFGDIGCHQFSAIFKALNLGHPEWVEACSTNDMAPPEIAEESAPLSSIVRYHFAAQGDRPAVEMTWWDGGMMPKRPAELEPGRRMEGGDGTLYIGDKGKMLGHRLIPESKMQEYGRVPKTLARSPGHHREWIDACKGGKPAGSNFVDHGGLLTEVVLLGLIAIRTKEKLYWDGQNMRFTNSERANEYLNPRYRTGWTL